MPRRSLVGLLCLLLSPLAPIRAQDRGFRPEDYYKIVNVSEAVVSPTGAYVAFTVTTVAEEENTRHEAIWLQPLRNGRPDGDTRRPSCTSCAKSATRSCCSR